MFIPTTTISRIRDCEKRIKILQGGTWSGKTYGVLPDIIDRLCRTKRKARVIAETIPAVKAGAFEDFKEIMENTGRWNESSYNKTERRYTFGNGSTLKFTAYDSVGKAKADGKFNDTFINEANHVSFPVADATLMRTSGNVWIDFNPDSEFWAHTEILPKKDSELMVFTYKDNEACPQVVVEELEERLAKAFFDPFLGYEELFVNSNIKSNYWANWCKVYVFGEVGQLQGVCIPNWKQIDNIPPEARLLGVGLDFGYSNDPTGIVEIWKWNDSIIVNEVAYEKGISNKQIAKRIKDRSVIPPIVVCDSADPKSIAELRNYGINAVACVKGKDSIVFGIGKINEQKIYVTSGSLNLIKELRNYKWLTDKDGNTLNRPIDDFNHLIDGLRYIVTHVFGEPKKRKKKIISH